MEKRLIAKFFSTLPTYSLVNNLTKMMKIKIITTRMKMTKYNRQK